jgi:hypothetical protein
VLSRFGGLLHELSLANCDSPIDVRDLSHSNRTHTPGLGVQTSLQVGLSSEGTAPRRLRSAILVSTDGDGVGRRHTETAGDRPRFRSRRRPRSLLPAASCQVGAVPASHLDPHSRWCVASVVRARLRGKHNGRNFEDPGRINTDFTCDDNDRHHRARDLSRAQHDYHGAGAGPGQLVRTVGLHCPTRVGRQPGCRHRQRILRRPPVLAFDLAGIWRGWQPRGCYSRRAGSCRGPCPRRSGVVGLAEHLHTVWRFLMRLACSRRATAPDRML